MAIKETCPSTIGLHSRHDFVMDTDVDATNLPADVAAGSTAISCASANVFIMNASGQWVKLGGDN